MAQTAAHLADHVIPPVPVRQWVISVPKRLRGMLADRPAAVAALTKIFLDEIERLLCAAAGVTRDAATPHPPARGSAASPSCHRFGSALNHHVHLHACVTDGVFVPAADQAGVRRPADVPAGPADHPGRSGRAHRAGPPPRDPVVPACSACSTPRPPPTCSPGRTAGFQSTPVSGSRLSTAMCRAIFRVSSTCCGTAPGPPSRSSGSP